LPHPRPPPSFPTRRSSDLHGIVARIARRHPPLDLLRALGETGALLLRTRPLARLRPEIALALGDLARLVAQRVTRRFGLRDGRRDRKSTRLNSSHLGNSYA